MSSRFRQREETTNRETLMVDSGAYWSRSDTFGVVLGRGRSDKSQGNEIRDGVVSLERAVGVCRRGERVKLQHLLSSRRRGAAGRVDNSLVWR